jgi:lysophospholipid acyltransferase (LPLAT)-like uncharacterized protein
MLMLAGTVGPMLIRIYGKTWRIDWEGMEHLSKAREKRGNVLLCTWHSRLLGLCYSHRHRNIGIMVSKSYDGEWISRIVIKLGYRTYRGSASRNGVPALVKMLRNKDSGDLALTVDGPRGPAEKVKLGAIALASRSGLPIVPISYAASSAWRLNSWDHFIMPRPFSKITVRYGQAIEIPRDISADDMTNFAVAIEDGINRIG